MGLTLMVDQTRYVVVCSKVNSVKPNDCIYLVPREKFRNAQEDKILTVYLAHNNEGTVKMFYDANGETKLSPFPKQFKKSELIELI